LESYYFGGWIAQLVRHWVSDARLMAGGRLSPINFQETLRMKWAKELYNIDH